MSKRTQKPVHYLDQFWPVTFLPRAKILPRTIKATAKVAAEQIVEASTHWDKRVWSEPKEFELSLQLASEKAADAAYPDEDNLETIVAHATWWPYRELVESLVITTLKERAAT